MEIVLPSLIGVIVACLIVAIASVAWSRNNVFLGIGVAIVGTMLLPTWIRLTAFDVAMDLRVVVAAIGVVAAAIARPKWIYDRLLLVDVMVLFLCVWQTISEWLATHAVGEPLLLSYGFWVLPYLAGRCSARTVHDLKWIAHFVCGLTIIFAGCSLIEECFGKDLFEVLFGEKPGTEFHPRKGKRWGFIRYEGTYTHPIFFGTVMMLMLPWSTWLSLIRTGKSRVVGFAGMIGTIASAIAAISRGPLLGMLVSLIFAAAAKYKKVLGAMVAAGLLLAGMLVSRPAYFEDVTLWFSRLSGERENTVLIDDQSQIKTSSMTRVLLIQHYWKSVKGAGIIGYGMTATDTFPPNVPHVPYDEATGKQYPLIDNSYILLALRGGWLMCLAFVLLHAAAIYQFHAMTKRHPELVSFGRLMIGAICAHAFVVFTVYPDYDFMFVFLWTVGISSIRLQADESEKLGRVSGEPSIAE